MNPEQLAKEQDTRREIFNSLEKLEGFKRLTPTQQDMVRMSFYIQDRAERPDPEEGNYSKSSISVRREWCHHAAFCLENEIALGQPKREIPYSNDSFVEGMQMANNPSLEQVISSIKEIGFPAVVSIGKKYKDKTSLAHTLVALGEDSKGEILFWNKKGAGRHPYLLQSLSNFWTETSNLLPELVVGIRPFRNSASRLPLKDRQEYTKHMEKPTQVDIFTSLNREASKIENAETAEEAIPAINALMEQIRTLDLSAIDDASVVEGLGLIMQFSSNSIAKYAPAELRTEAENFDNQVRTRGWNLFVDQRKKEDVENADSISKTIDADFASYMKAVRFFSPNPQEYVRRATEIFQKIMDEELPSDNIVVRDIAHEAKHIGPYPYEDLAATMSPETRAENIPGYREYYDLMMKAAEKVMAKQKELAAKS